MLLISRFKIQGHSMEPTILDGETVLVSSIPYLFSKPKVGDIVVVQMNYRNRHSGNPPVGGASRIILISKRTDRFWTSLSTSSSRPRGKNDKEKKFLVKRIAKIENANYFVKGDNEKDSMDSRRLGWIERKEIVGKAIYKFRI